MATQDNQEDEYSYRNSGLNDFFIRRQDSAFITEEEEQTSAGKSGAELNFDDIQLSGSLGSTLQIGNLRLNGVDGRIEQLNDAGEIIGVVGNLENL